MAKKLANSEQPRAKPTRAALYLSDIMNMRKAPVLSLYDFGKMICRMYLEASGKNLYLRQSVPDRQDGNRLRSIMTDCGFVGPDKDYGGRVIRVLSVSDLPADQIACLVDPFCYVSHLSAMQSWGLTNRRSKALILSRPNAGEARRLIDKKEEQDNWKGQPSVFPFRRISHPTILRGRETSVHEFKSLGRFVEVRGSFSRISTIGQTFLDMVQHPDLCGGMSHVLDVWQDWASQYVDEILSVVDSVASPLVKARAGYILEERIGIQNDIFAKWKMLGGRGGSRLLDPSREFSSLYSEAWMISINV